MKELAQRLVGAIFNLKVAVGICGVLLSIGAHELFHIMVHFGEIDSVHLFPDTQAIVEILFTPSADYNLPIEETIAYIITMITLILTAMLIGDIHDLREQKTVGQTILDNNFQATTREDEQQLMSVLSDILGVRPVA